MDSGQWTVISGQQAVDGGQWTAGSLSEKKQALSAAGGLWSARTSSGLLSFWRVIKKRFGSGYNDLVSTADLLTQLKGFETRELGIQQVPLDRVVGSSRPQDFDLQFGPRRREENGRWSSVASSVALDKHLPPPNLLKIQNSYFVEDGNHRISVARSKGQNEMRAKVTELDVNGLETEPTCSRLGFRVRTQQDLYRVDSV